MKFTDIPEIIFLVGVILLIASSTIGIFGHQEPIGYLSSIGVMITGIGLRVFKVTQPNQTSERINHE